MAFASEDADLIVLVSGPPGMDLVDPRVVATMWRHFADLSEFEPHEIDTTERKLATR